MNRYYIAVPMEHKPTIVALLKTFPLADWLNDDPFNYKIFKSTHYAYLSDEEIILLKLTIPDIQIIRHYGRYE